MAKISGRWLLTASLTGVLVSSVPALSQSDRPWVDPPPVSATTGQPSAPTPSPLPAAPPPRAAVPPPATVEAPPPAATASRDAAAADKASPETPDTKTRTKQAAGKERKVISRSQQTRAASRDRKQAGQTARRRSAGPAVSRAVPSTTIDRRVRVSRNGSLQRGQRSGLQVMRLRTIELPDGRRIDILTRPNQDIASGLPDGF